MNLFYFYIYQIVEHAKKSLINFFNIKNDKILKNEI